jgi:hypothetical protein
MLSRNSLSRHNVETPYQGRLTCGGPHVTDDGKPMERDMDKYEKERLAREAEYVKQHEKQIKELEQFVPNIPALDGFTSDWVEDTYFYGGNQKSKNFVMTNDAESIKFTFRPGGDGTTEFKNEDHWLSFDRRGVDSSFYWKPFDYEKAEQIDIRVVLELQLKRVAERREYSKTAISIPDVGYTTSPEGLVRLKQHLKTKGWVSFYPSGFGTGYVVTRKTPRQFGVRRAKPELEKFFEMSPLYVESVDCD